MSVELAWVARGQYVHELVVVPEKMPSGVMTIVSMPIMTTHRLYDDILDRGVNDYIAEGSLDAMMVVGLSYALDYLASR